jgi:hypothetical protein
MDDASDQLGVLDFRMSLPAPQEFFASQFVALSQRRNPLFDCRGHFRPPSLTIVISDSQEHNKANDPCLTGAS